MFRFLVLVILVILATTAINGVRGTPDSSSSGIEELFQIMNSSEFHRVAPEQWQQAIGNVPEGVLEKALVWAARNGSESVFKTLMSDNRVCPPVEALDSAVKFGHVGILKLLFDCNNAIPRVDIQNDLLRSLYLASQYGRSEAVTFILERAKRDSISFSELELMDCTKLAVYQNDSTTLNVLLKGNPEVPLHSPTLSIYMKIMFRLSNYEGVQVLASDPRLKEIDHDMIANACNSSDTKTVELLLRHPNVTKLIVSHLIYINKGRPQMLNILFRDPRFNVSASDNLAIKTTAEKGYADSVKILLQDPRVDPNAGGGKAIRSSSENGHEAVVELLMESGKVDLTVQNNYPIRMAAKNGHLNVVKLLLKNPKVNPMADNDFAMREAMKNGHTAVVELLSSYYMSVSAVEMVPFLPGKKGLVIAIDSANASTFCSMESGWELEFDEFKDLGIKVLSTTISSESRCLLALELTWLQQHLNSSVKNLTLLGKVANRRLKPAVFEISFGSLSISISHPTLKEDFSSLFEGEVLNAQLTAHGFDLRKVYCNVVDGNKLHVVNYGGLVFDVCMEKPVALVQASSFFANFSSEPLASISILGTVLTFNIKTNAFKVPFFRAESLIELNSTNFEFHLNEPVVINLKGGPLLFDELLKRSALIEVVKKETSIVAYSAPVASTISIDAVQFSSPFGEYFVRVKLAGVSVSNAMDPGPVAFKIVRPLIDTIYINRVGNDLRFVWISERCLALPLNTTISLSNEGLLKAKLVVTIDDIERYSDDVDYCMPGNRSLTVPEDFSRSVNATMFVEGFVMVSRLALKSNLEYREVGSSESENGNDSFFSSPVRLGLVIAASVLAFLVLVMGGLLLVRRIRQRRQWKRDSLSPSLSIQSNSIYTVLNSDKY